METLTSITKKTREVGTSAGVLLPRSWLNKQVVVTLFEPSLDKILVDVMNCLITLGLNEEAKGVYLFGSYARGDFKKGSDIDILIQPTKEMSLLDLSGLKIELEEVLNRKVDLVSYNYIHPYLKKKILEGEVRII